MSPLSKTLSWAALAAVAVARPANIARQQAPEAITTVYTWVTVNVPVTLWVNEQGEHLSTVAQGGNFAAETSTVSSTSVVVTSTAEVASTYTSVVTSTTSAVAVAPMAPVETPPPAPVTTLITTSSSVPEATTPAAPAQVQRQVTTSAAAAATPAAAAGGSTSDVSASSSNLCVGPSDACSGDITYYEGGLGACGWNVNTATDYQIALPYEFMGVESNSNKYCGKSVTIKNPTTGQTVSATVGDKCMGCTGRSIDLTDVLFKAIGGGCDGRCSGFEWWLN